MGERTIRGVALVYVGARTYHLRDVKTVNGLGA
jgi:hypothetical protein